MNGHMRMMPYRMLMAKASKGETISIFEAPYRMKEMVYIKNFVQVAVKAIQSDLEGGFYNIGCSKRVFLDEMVYGIAEVFSTEDKKSVITYGRNKPDTRQSMLVMSKQKEPRYKLQYMYSF